MATPSIQKPRIRVKARRGRPLGIEGEKMVVAGATSQAFVPGRKGGLHVLTIDEILRRKGWATYRDMRHDDQVKVCMSFKKILVHGRAWEIKPADESDQAKDIAEFVEFNLKAINFEETVKQALTALDFGYSIGELVWEVKDFKGSLAVHLKAIKHRDPEGMEINIDKHGNLVNFIQARQISGVVPHHVIVEPNKVWYFVHQGEFGNPNGMSDLRAAYRSWWAKKFIVNFWNVFLERMGQPMTLMKYPVGASPDLKDALQGILRGLSTKTEILVPEGVEVELIEATRAGKGDYEKALQFHNQSIARAILMVSMLGAGGDNVQRGSDSQSRIHLRVLFKMADALSKSVLWTFEKQVIKQLVDMNFKHDGLYPSILYQDYGEFEGIEIADTIRLLHAAGIFDMDQADVNYARSVLGLPLRGEGDPEDDVVRPQPLPPPGDPNKPPPAAGQANDRAQGGKESPNATAK